MSTSYYIVTAEVLSRFKEPFGTLIEGSPAQTMKTLRGIVEKEQPPKIISVGDTVTRNMHKHKIVPQLSITDNLNRRQKTRPQTLAGKVLVKIHNPQGKITQEAIAAVQDALQGSDNVHLLVEGEEDLLTLIVALYAPVNSLIIYGQPQKGVVVVKVTQEKRADAQKIWNHMKKIESSV
jgi:uncharacterized protein (UPF0218 family)